MALRIGITGGIGSGKTTVCQIFETLGIPVFYSDDCAKEILVSNLAVKQQIVGLFGLEAYQLDGQLNRPLISSKIFTDKHLLAQMNQIVHPAVFQAYETWQDAHRDAVYTVNESALLFETGRYQQMNANILVTCPLETRIARIMLRDQSTHEQVMRKVNNQMSEDEKLKLADYVVVNDGITLLVPQVVKVHHILGKK
jgi:dephospho-CoA kinase